MKEKLNYPKLNPIIKQKILKALRSGEYKYVNGTLHRIRNGEDTYCALGVVYHCLGISNSTLRGKANISKVEVPDKLEKCIPKMFLTNTKQAENAHLPADKIITLNDKSMTKSYQEAAEFIEDNL